MKDLREKLELTQQQMADYLGVARAFVAQIETGRRAHSAKTAERIVALSKWVRQAELDLMSEENLPDATKDHQWLTAQEIEQLKKRLHRQLRGLERKLGNLEKRLKKLSMLDQQHMLWNALERTLDVEDKRLDAWFRMQQHEKRTQAKGQNLEREWIRIECVMVRNMIEVLPQEIDNLNQVN